MTTIKLLDLRTEAQIERSAERQMDHLDKCLLEGHMDQQAYDCAVFALNVWTVEQYKRLKPTPDYVDTCQITDSDGVTRRLSFQVRVF